MEEKTDRAIDVIPTQSIDSDTTSNGPFEPDEEYEMRMCCGQVTSCDKGLLEFIAKTVVSLSVLSFCFLQLSQSKQSEFASSTVSLILGTYLGSTVMATPPKKSDP
jgi:hypothetical protein